jgi:hypothetical protein
MAVTAQGVGTQTAVIGTEHILLDVAIAGTFTLHVDLNNMANGDILEIRPYQIILTGGFRHVVYVETFSDAPSVDNVIQIFSPISNELTDAGSLRFTLKQTAGTGRAFPWKVLRYG